MGFYLQVLISFWSRGAAKSRDKAQPLHIHYQSDYGRQTWQDDS